MFKKPNYLFSAADYTKLIVVGGYNGAYLDTVEVIGLEGSEDDCPDSLPPYPVTLRYPTVAILGGRVTACGGVLLRRRGEPGGLLRIRPGLERLDRCAR